EREQRRAPRRLLRRASEGRSRRPAAGRRRARLLRLVAARQLRVGAGLLVPLRHRSRRLRDTKAHPQGQLPRLPGHAAQHQVIWRPASGGLWQDRRFLTFWSAQAVSEFGDRISELALPLIAVTLLNATPAEVGLLTAAVWTPNLVSLFVGSWVDQQPD